MSYNEKPQLKLYAFKNNAFKLQAIIDDFQEVSFEHNLYQAGQFTITINYNIPNALLFERGMFIQFGSDPYDFGEILSIRDVIGQDGKGSQIRTITGYDARYIFKRRIIKNLNANGMWKMTAKGELCLRNLIADQCGANAEEKRRLPVTNTIPQESDAIGKEYSVSEQFTNLYEVCKTIATQSEIGWRVRFESGNLTLECFEGTNRSDTVQFSTDFDSLRDGEFSDSSESYSNAIYIGGKGQNDERDIYEGEDGTPNGLERFESWDDQSQMTTTDEYTAEALSMLSQYGQTVNVSGNGLAKCPYVYKEQYDVGDIITIAFSGKTAKVQILSVTERWAWNQYDINFSFGKPQNTLAEQLQLMLRKIQGASNKEKATESVKWYTIPTATSMPADDVTFNTIGFTGTLTKNSTFTLYRDSEGTGAKTYNVYCKNLSGNYTLTLTTGVSGATNFTIKGGSNIVARILVDENGNIVSQSMTATDTIESGNNQPATSGAVFDEYKIIKYTNGGVNFNTLFPEGDQPTGGSNQKIYFVYGVIANPNKNAPNNLATTNFIVFATNGNGRVLQIAYENQMNGELVFIRTLDYNHTTWSPWKSLNNVYEITDADLVIPKVEKYGVCFAPNVRTNVPSDTTSAIWCITSFLSYDINGFYYVNQIAQGYSSVNDFLYIREGYGSSKNSITFSAWRKIVNSSLDDQSLNVITNSVTKYLGVNEVTAYRKGNMAYIYISGTHTGSPTSSTQVLLTNLPAKYRPKINQSFGVTSYNTTSPFVYPSRIIITLDGSINLAESGIPTNAQIRMGFVYIVE